jgi:hypothetical protein
LSSSFDRRFGHLPSSARLEVWTRLTQAWSQSCEEAGLSNDIVGDERKLWALGQHYGLPTRLLDWSLSPYVAAFFGFNDCLLRRDSATSRVAVWILHTSSSAWTSELGVEIVSAPSLDNVRLRNQSGKFTFSRTPLPSLEEHVRQCACSGTALTKAVMPASEARAALADLDAMGINGYQLFPDLSGLAQLITMRVVLGISDSSK